MAFALVGGVIGYGALGGLAGAAVGAAAGGAVGSLINRRGGGNGGATQVDPNQVGTDSLATQLRLAPDVYSANARYAPQYAKLNQNILRDQLLGTPSFDAQGYLRANPRLEESWKNDPGVASVYGSLENYAKADYQSNGAQYDPTGQFMRNSGGLIDLYGQLSPQLSAQQAAANRAQREADIADVGALGSKAREAYLAANPDLARTMTGLDDRIALARNVTPTALSNSYAPPAGTLSAATAATPGAIAGTSANYNATLPTALAASPGNLRAQQSRFNAQLPVSEQAAPGTLAAAYASAPGRVSATQAGPTSLTPTLLTDAANYKTKSSLQQTLEQQAAASLAQNGELSAEDIRVAQQSARSAAAARGIYDSNSAMSAEVLNTDAMRRQRQSDARTFAAGVDASGQAQLDAGRSFATGIENQQQNVGTFNAGQTNSLASQAYGTEANVNMTNAGAANAANAQTYNARQQQQQFNANAGNTATLARYQTGAQQAQFNAGQANSLASQAYSTNANLNLANAGALNSAATTQYGTGAQLAQFNAGQANSLASQAYATNAQTNQFNAGQVNATNSQNFAQQNQNAQFGAQMDASRQLNQTQLDRTAQLDQFGREFQLAQMYQSQATDPYQMVLGRSSVPGQTQGFVGQGAATTSTSPTLFNPFDSNITSIYAGNAANATAQNVAAGNNRSAVQGSALGAIGSLASAYFMAGCWVARAAFGDTNPRWLATRRWMQTKAPRGLWELYLARGPLLAKQLLSESHREMFRSVFRRLIRGDAAAVAELTSALNAA